MTQADARGQGDGSVTFTIAANGDPAGRAAALNVSDVRMQISQDGKPCEFRLSTTHETVDAAGGQRTISVDASSAQCSWSITGDVPWITIARAGEQTGSGEAVIEIAPSAAAPRTGTVTVAGHSVTIDQGPGCTAVPATITFDVGPAGGRLEVPVIAPPDCAWSARPEDAWLAIIDGHAATGNGVVRLDVQATAGPPRSGAIIVAGHRVGIQQGGGCAATPAVTTASVNAAGGRLEVSVLAPAGCAWSARAEDAWIAIIDGHAATGNGVVRLDVPATAGPPRSGAIIVAGHRVVIQQGGGCVVTPAVITASVNAAGGRLDVPVLAANGCPWTAQSEAPWITITSGADGGGPGTVVLSVAATDGPLRTGTVNVAGVRLVVTQLSGCSYSVQPTSYAAAAAGATSSVTVQTAAGCPWTATSGAPWITIPQPSGSGPAPVPFVVAANNSPSRTGTLTVAGSTIAVAQASPCTWTLTPPSVDYPADGGRGAVLVIVAGGCTWSAASTVSWIAIDTGHTGAGDGLVQFVVSPNPGPARSGVVRIGGLDLIARQSGR